MTPCTVCGCAPRLDIIDGRLRDLRLLLGPRNRPALGGGREPLCWSCATWAARFVGILL